MRVTVTQKGPTLESLTAETIRDLRAANRKAGRELSRVGIAAMRDGAPTMWGKRLAVKSEVDAWPDRVTVEFYPAPGSAGGWAIAESGARPHDIHPRARKALKFSGLWSANVDHPGARGRRAWSLAGERLAAVLDRQVESVYDDAMDA